MYSVHRSTDLRYGICGQGIDVGTAVSVWVENCEISNNTTGAAADSSSDRHVFDYNNWYNNTADVSNVSKGSNATAYDPNYEGADDFRSGSGSSIREAGYGIDLGVSVAGKPDQGAWQSDSNGGGGGASPVIL